MLVLEKKRSKIEFKAPDAKDICVAVYTLTMLIPPGFVTSYSSIAKTLGVHPRRVALCLKNNSWLIIIPCHRVVYSTRKLGGYSKLGKSFKKKLLMLEGVVFEDEDTVSRSNFIDLENFLGSNY
jgi:O-6-methylguanine DNA methyltransferase